MSWYEYPSNYSNGTSVDGIGNFFQYTNYVIDGQLGLLIMLISYIVSFLALKSASSDKAFAGASFFGFIISVLLYRIQLIPFQYLIIPIIMLVVAVIVARSEREKIGL